MKRSASLGLVVMGAAAFTATFAGGSAFMAWKYPAHSQTCTPRPDGTQACTPSRTPAGVARYIHLSLFPNRAVAAAPTAKTAGIIQPARHSTALAGGSPAADRTVRRGFGNSAKTAFRGSAGG